MENEVEEEITQETEEEEVTEEEEIKTLETVIFNLRMADLKLKARKEVIDMKTYWGKMKCQYIDGGIDLNKAIIEVLQEVEKDYNNAFNDGKKEAYEEMMKFISEKQ